MDPRTDPDLDEDGNVDVEWFPIPKGLRAACDELTKSGDDNLQKAAGHKYDSRTRGPHGWVYHYKKEHGSYSVGKDTISDPGGAAKWHTTYKPEGGEDRHVIDTWGGRGDKERHGRKMHIGTEHKSKGRAEAAMAQHHTNHTVDSSGVHGSLSSAKARKQLTAYLTRKISGAVGAQRIYLGGLQSMVDRMGQGKSIADVKRAFSAHYSSQGKSIGTDAADAAYKVLMSAGDGLAQKSDSTEATMKKSATAPGDHAWGDHGWSI